MPTKPVTLTIVNSNGSTQKATINVKDVKFINCVITMKDGTITEADFERLQKILRSAGDAGILEEDDLSSTQKLELAKLNGYTKLYDIKLSDDGKFYEITVKEKPWYYPDPMISHIKKDFGLRENVFLNNNRNLVGDHPDDPETGNYDFNKIKGGTTFKIPVAEAHFDKSPNGFLGRLF